MPLTSKGEEIKSNMEKTYGPKKGESVFYASANKGTIKGVHNDRRNAMSNDVTVPDPATGPMSTKGPSDKSVNNLPEASEKKDVRGLDCGSAMSLDAIKAMGKRIGKY